MIILSGVILNVNPCSAEYLRLFFAPELNICEAYFITSLYAFLAIPNNRTKKVVNS